jgi:hypothetical protein
LVWQPEVANNRTRPKENEKDLIAVFITVGELDENDYAMLPRKRVSGRGAIGGAGGISSTAQRELHPTASPGE